MPSTRRSRGRSVPSHFVLALSLAAALAVTGCASSKRAVGTHASATQGYAAPGSDAARQAVGYWGQAYEKAPDNRENILNYAAALRRNSQIPQAEAVLRKAVINKQSDRDIAAAYGKILAMGGKLPEALQVIKGAQTPTRPDWRLLSAEAAIEDQMGNTNKARSLYGQALKIAPDEPSLLNNLAMSYLLAGEVKQAEEILQKAAASPKADSRIRQNLALSIGLQGRFQEAESVARSELDPAQANQNIAYLKSMLAQRNSWAEISAAEKKKRGG
ncbi:tetratricopeptide repeat protein [Stappia stellulata]|uniref:tetratricopeptide repeat protein n=1 Tax=Stappia stellulata TaxID=71235 RepID=UPI0004061315|nr:tetratricopeptide repeat protein [Stappia stellulata]